MTKNYTCLICGRPLADYDPAFCCDGHGCGCMGIPVNPPTCSQECDHALFSHIGHPFEERRQLAGIPLWTDRKGQENE